MSTYNPNIPQATDNLSNSQGDLLDNFGQLNTQFGVDHTAFNTGAANGDGFHKQVTLPTPLGGVPSTLTVDGYGALYTKAVSGLSQVFFANRAASTNTEYQLSFPMLNGSSGYVTLPGGVIIQWGNDVAGYTSLVQPVVFPIAFPTACFTAVICTTASNTDAGSVNDFVTFRTGTITTTGFSVTPSLRISKTAMSPVFMNYIAIGN